MAKSTQTDWTKERAAALLDAATNAVTRARYIFMAINVAGVLIVIAAFNGTVPWTRLLMKSARTPESIKKILPDLVFRDLSTVSIPLLGSKISASDLAPVGSVAMALLVVWFWYALRRENHVIRAVHRDANAAWNSDLSDLARYLYHGVAHYFVFTTITDNNVPVGDKRSVTASPSVRFLFFMPAWIPVFLIVVDLFSLFSTFTLNRDVNPAAPPQPLWDMLNNGEKTEVQIRLVFAAVVGLFCVWKCFDCWKFDRNTREAISDLQRHVEPEFDRPIVWKDPAVTKPSG